MKNRTNVAWFIHSNLGNVFDMILWSYPYVMFELNQKTLSQNPEDMRPKLSARLRLKVSEKSLNL